MEKKDENVKEVKAENLDMQFISTSFDGTIKLWETSSENPLQEVKSKNHHDFFPFGGVCAFRSEANNKVHFLMSGNKKDSSINLWALK